MKNINEWTQKEFEALPKRKWNEDVGEFDSLVIIPKRYLHDSGFPCMDFASVKDGKPKYLLSGCSDVIHINGMGGYGFDWFKKYSKIPDKVKPISWSIDCLKTSKLIRLFAGTKLVAGNALSSFEIYAIPEKNE